MRRRMAAASSMWADRATQLNRACQEFLDSCLEQQPPLDAPLTVVLKASGGAGPRTVGGELSAIGSVPSEAAHQLLCGALLEAGRFVAQAMDADSARRDAGQEMERFVSALS